MSIYGCFNFFKEFRSFLFSNSVYFWANITIFLYVDTMERIKFVRLWKIWSNITEEIVVNNTWQHLSYKHKCVCYCVLFCVFFFCAMHLICSELISCSQQCGRQCYYYSKFTNEKTGAQRVYVPSSKSQKILNG